MLRLLSRQKPFGTEFKQLMRSSLLRDRLCGIELIGEDLPYATNWVHLHQGARWRGPPVARITTGLDPPSWPREALYMPWIIKPRKRPVPTSPRHRPAPLLEPPIGQDQAPATEHVMGGMPMGADARTSVTDEQGRHHHLDNLFVADGPVFPTSGGHNPTLTTCHGPAPGGQLDRTA